MVEAMNTYRPQYTPEEAAAKRKELYEDLKASLEAKGQDASRLTVSFAPELEPEHLGGLPKVPNLERNPEEDVVLFSAVDKAYAGQPQMLMAKMTPQEAGQWIAVAGQLGDLVAKFGPKVIDFFAGMFGATKPNPTVEPPRTPKGVPTTAPAPKAPPKGAMTAKVAEQLANLELIKNDLDPESSEYGRVQAMIDKLSKAAA